MQAATDPIDAARGERDRQLGARQRSSLPPSGACAALLLAALITAEAPAAQAARVGRSEDASQAEVIGLLRDVAVRTQPIYAGVEPSERLLPGLVNAVHWTTREDVVLQEVWLRRGDPVTRADLDELERKLRNTGFFAEVRVSTSAPDAAGLVDLSIETRDRLSLILGVSGSFVGEVGSVTARVGEANLFGSGDALTLEYERNSEGEVDGSIAYTDRHVLGEWLRLSTFARTTQEGEGFGARLYRPRRQLAEPWEWSLGGFSETSGVDYFEGGDSVAEVPLDQLALDGSLARGSGRRAAYWQSGLRVRYEREEFGPARGPQAGRIDVPGDTTTLFAGPSLRFDKTARFDRTERLDTLGFVQDLRLGGGVELVVGGEHRAEEGTDERLEPSAFGRAYVAFEPVDETFLTLELNGARRWRGGDSTASSLGAVLHGYHLAGGGHTLAGSLSFDDVFEGEGLPSELTLGEDNGLRGYPSREFSGTRRLRVNLEERFDPELAWRSLHFGGVLFADAGWIADDGEGLGAPRRSVGIGLRIGSAELFGFGVLRIDLAFPLDERDGASYEPLLSVAFGQVFTFFGNDSLLSSR